MFNYHIIQKTKMTMFQIKERIKLVKDAASSSRNYTAKVLVTTYYILFIPVVRKETILSNDL